MISLWWAYSLPELHPSGKEFGLWPRSCIVTPRAKPALATKSSRHVQVGGSCRWPCSTPCQVGTRSATTPPCAPVRAPSPGKARIIETQRSVEHVVWGVHSFVPSIWWFGFVCWWLGGFPFQGYLKTANKKTTRLAGSL